MTPEEYIDKLIEISNKKLDGLREIFTLTSQQSTVISEENAEELNKLINLKQLQIDIIDELDQAFEVYYLRLKSILGVQSIEEIRVGQFDRASELKQIITTIYDIVKKIQVLEIENKNKVQAIVTKLAKDIRRVRQSKVANNGYNIGAKLPQQSYFIDKKK